MHLHQLLATPKKAHIMKDGLHTNEHGDKEWFLNGRLHREDGPAIEFANGNKWWFLHGLQHRENGPAIENINGTKQWFLHGKRHREDGPAIERATGIKEWFLHDKKHRADGPAYQNGNSVKYWLFGKNMTKETFQLHTTQMANKNLEMEYIWMFIK